MKYFTHWVQCWPSWLHWQAMGCQSWHWNIYGAVDSSQLTLLALFSISAAFDTVNHEILLQLLQLIMTYLRDLNVG